MSLVPAPGSDYYDFVIGDADAMMLDEPLSSMTELSPDEKRALLAFLRLL